MSKSLKLVIFDCDGTIVDSQHMIVAAMASAYGWHGMDAPSRERVLSIVGLSLPEAFEALGKDQPGFPVATMIERYKAAFHVMRDGEKHLEPLYPGAAEAIVSLARRDDVLLGIATGKSQRGVRAVLTMHGLLDHFITIKTAEDAAILGRDADGVVVGTALCNAIGDSLVEGVATAGTVQAARDLVASLAAGVRRART